MRVSDQNQITQKSRAELRLEEEQEEEEEVTPKGAAATKIHNVIVFAIVEWKEEKRPFPEVILTVDASTTLTSLSMYGTTANDRP